MIIVAGKNNIAVHAIHELVNKFGHNSVGIVLTRTIMERTHGRGPS